jgi:hypothetical protein
MTSRRFQPGRTGDPLHAESLTRAVSFRPIREERQR